MKKYILTGVITSVLMIGVFTGIILLLNGNQKKEDLQQQKERSLEMDMADTQEEKEKVNDRDVIVLSADKGNLLTYQYKDKEDIYDAAHSAAVKKELDKKKLISNYTLENPLCAKNPFGTNNLSLYLYFETKEKGYVKYTVHVKDPDVVDFTRTLYSQENNKLSNKHEYQLTGLIPGQDNYVIVRLYNKKDKLINKTTYKIAMGKLNKNIPVKMKMEKGTSKQEMSNGLFFVLGYDTKNKKAPRDILLYDNSGCLRGDIPLVNYRSDRIEFIDNNMIYSFKYNGFASVSALGQVMNVYEFDGYSQHHDFIYNGYGQLWILATQKGKTSEAVEDVVISLDLSTGKTAKLLDFEDLLKKVRKKAKKKNESDTRLDWIHLNSITMTGSNEIIVSSRELSSLIKVSNVTSLAPKVEYIISCKDPWKGTGYSKLLLEKASNQKEQEDSTPAPTGPLEDSDTAKPDEADFLDHFGQHTITYQADPSLEEGQYYLYLYNNNFGHSNTRRDIKWNQFDDIGLSGKPAKFSTYYKYLVDEVNGTYSLAESFPVPYSAIVSSAQDYENGNRIVNSGMAHLYGEYDKEGKLIYQYDDQASTYTYRVYKYNMKNFWYQ